MGTQSTTTGYIYKYIFQAHKAVVRLLRMAGRVAITSTPAPCFLPDLTLECLKKDLPLEWSAQRAHSGLPQHPTSDWRKRCWSKQAILPLTRRPPVTVTLATEMQKPAIQPALRGFCGQSMFKVSDPQTAWRRTRDSNPEPCVLAPRRAP